MIVTDLSTSFNPCPKPSKKVKESKNKRIGLKSNKLSKLEKERYSILTTNLKKCYLCNKKKEHIHEIYKGCNRQISMKNGFCIPICSMCHIETDLNSELDKGLKKLCQKEYEKTHTREKFIKLIKKSYI